MLTESLEDIYQTGAAKGFKPRAVELETREVQVDFVSIVM